MKEQKKSRVNVRDRRRGRNEFHRFIQWVTECRVHVIRKLVPTGFSLRSQSFFFLSRLLPLNRPLTGQRAIVVVVMSLLWPGRQPATSVTGVGRTDHEAAARFRRCRPLSCGSVQTSSCVFDPQNLGRAENQDFFPADTEPTAIVLPL